MSKLLKSHAVGLPGTENQHMGGTWPCYATVLSPNTSK